MQGFFVFTLLTLFICDDVELNSGPKNRNFSFRFSICHWNLNNRALHNFKKVDYFEAQNTGNKFDIIYLSESYLDSSKLSNNETVSIKGSELVRDDRIDDVERDLKKLVADRSNRNPYFVLITGDFNTKSTNWFINETTTCDEPELDSLMTLYGLRQLITELTHILENLSSCIDLIFTNPLNIIIDSGIHTTLHSNCHHQITQSKLNLKI